ncbi:MAG: plastocyanin/azurin family copper-binding protein [Thermomicrobiales bacterium]|nr:plastocyanin/azurin family copper-binding protein [Thermomicrobiales bacterium]
MDETKTTNSGRGARFWVTIMLGGAAALVVLCVGISLGGLYIANRISEPGDPVSGVTDVAVRDNTFSPDSIEIEPGTTVTWTWEGKSDHNVYGDGLESPIQKTGTYAYTFDDSGQYDYECTLHPGMKGRVIVTDEAAGGTA